MCMISSFRDEERQRLYDQIGDIVDRLSGDRILSRDEREQLKLKLSAVKDQVRMLESHEKSENQSASGSRGFWDNDPIIDVEVEEKDNAPEPVDPQPRKALPAPKQALPPPEPPEPEWWEIDDSKQLKV